MNVRLGVFVGLTLASAICCSAGQIIISQIYGGGGNSGAAFRNDFVELFNRSTNTISVDAWTLQYASASSSNWQSVALHGELEPGQYLLVQLGSGGSIGMPLPVADITAIINLSGSAGKLALVRASALLSGTCPEAASIEDLVGYGSSATCFEGGGPAPTPANSTALMRVSAGCFDANDNPRSFLLVPPSPRNRSSNRNICPSVSPLVALHEIQGAGPRSPLAGWHVTTTTNVITAVQSDGLYIQANDSEMDNDPATSEGLFVSLPNGVPLAVAVGQAITVTGVVEEAPPLSSRSRTQLIHAIVNLIGMTPFRPEPVSLTFQDLSPTGGLDRLESMRVRFESMTVCAPTEGFLIETNAQAVSDGVFHGIVTGAARPMREPGIPLLDPLPVGAPPAVPRFDQNPELLRVDSNGQRGAPRIEVTTGATLSNLIGVLAFTDGSWTLLPDPGAPTVSGNRSAMPVPFASAGEFTVASFNLERFFDAEEDPEVDETVLTAAAFSGRLNKASLAVRTLLRTPDILGLIEIENLSTLQTLASRVNSDAVAAGQTNPGYAAWLEEGNDIGGIDVGVLVRTSRVSVVEVKQFGKTNTFLNPLNGQEETLNDRPSLCVRATIARSSSSNALPVTVVVNHLRSLSGIDDPVDGTRVRTKRRAQAEFLARWVQERQASAPGEALILAGDFNAFQFNDGYVDVMGTIVGQPAPSHTVTLASPDLVEPNLLNLIEGLPAGERYSFCFEGNAQALDHALVNGAAQARLTRFQYARCNADFPESFRGNFNRPERLSDHDVPVAWFSSGVLLQIQEVAIANGSVVLKYQADVQQQVTLEVSDNLQSWDVSDFGTPDAFGRGVFSMPSAAGPRFYRLRTP